MVDLAKYRKAVAAVSAAAVTVLHAFNVPVAEDIPVQVVALYDAVAALLVYVLPND
jgi:hypothetical protein